MGTNQLQPTFTRSGQIERKDGVRLNSAQAIKFELEGINGDGGVVERLEEQVNFLTGIIGKMLLNMDVETQVNVVEAMFYWKQDRPGQTKASSNPPIPDNPQPIESEASSDQGCRILRELVDARNDFNDSAGAWGNGRVSREQTLRVEAAWREANAWRGDLRAKECKP